jgi:hypothetical protein
MIRLTDILKESEYAHYHNLRYGLTEQTDTDTWVPGEGPEREFGEVEIKRFRDEKVQQAYDQYIAMLNLMNQTHAKNGHSVKYTYAEPNSAILQRPLRPKDYKDLTKQVEQDLRNDIKKFQTAEYIREKLTKAGITHNFTNADILYEPSTLPEIRNAYATTQNKANGFTFSDFMAYYNLAGKQFDPEMKTLSADEIQNIKDMQYHVRHGAISEWVYENRHEILLAAEIAAAILIPPPFGIVVASGIGLSNAAAYYEEGDKQTAGLYALFALLPGVGKLAGKIAPATMKKIGTWLATKNVKWLDGLDAASRKIAEKLFSRLARETGEEGIETTIKSLTAKYGLARARTMATKLVGEAITSQNFAPAILKSAQITATNITTKVISGLLRAGDGLGKFAGLGYLFYNLAEMYNYLYETYAMVSDTPEEYMKKLEALERKSKDMDEDTAEDLTSRKLSDTEIKTRAEELAATY